MTPSPRLLPLLLLSVVAGCGTEEHLDRDALLFQQRLGDGAWLHGRNGRGSIRVTRAAGDSVIVTATRRTRGRRPEDVNFTVSRRHDEVIVCAVWGSTGRCDTDHAVETDRGLGGWLHALVRGRVDVDFVVAVPAGVRVDARQHTGDIAMEGVGPEIVAQAFRGNVRVSGAAGAIRVLAVHGDIIARLDPPPRDAVGDIVLESREGHVLAEVPAAFAADLELRAPAGSVSTDFENARGGDRVHTVTATVGGGGRALTLEARRGDVQLRTRG